MWCGHLRLRSAYRGWEWVIRLEKYGPVEGSNSLDAELGGCAMLIESLKFWLQKAESRPAIIKIQLHTVVNRSICSCLYSTSCVSARIACHPPVTDGWCADWACVTPAPETISVQHLCEDHEDDTVHSERRENLASTVGWRNTVLVSPRGYRRH